MEGGFSSPERACFVLLLLACAGCQGVVGSEYQEPDAPIYLNNSANVTQSFEVQVVAAGQSVRVFRSDGRNYTVEIIQGLSTISSGEYHYWTNIEFPETARLITNVTLAPGDDHRTTIEQLPRDGGVVVVLHQKGKIGWWTTVYCSDGALRGYEVHTRPHKFGDGWAGYSCL